MRRAARIAAWIAGGAIGLIVLLLAIVVIGGNTGPGRHLIEAAAAKRSGGAIEISGLGGRFPDRLRADHLALRKDGQVWLSVDGLSLDWRPWKLLLADLAITRLAARDASLERLPQSSGSSSGGGVALRVEIDALDVAKLTLAPDIAGTAASLSLAGNLSLQSTTQARFDVKARRLDGEGRYAASGTLAGDRVTARIDAQEPASGLLAGLGGLRNLGPLSIAAKLDGPRSGESLSLALAAGPARLDGHGTLDLDGKTLDLDLAGSAPAMAPRADLHWQSATLDAHIHGSFARLDAQGKLAIDHLAAGALRFDALHADLRGAGGAVTLDGAIDGLRLPGAAADLFAGAPLKLHATAALDQPPRPVTLALSHPLLEASAEANTGDGVEGTATITLGALQAFSAIVGVELDGQAQAKADFAAHGAAMRLDLDGRAQLTGDAVPAKLLGGDTHFALKATRQGETTTLDSFSLDGKALHAAAHGTLASDALDGTWSLALADLAPLAPQLLGSVDAQGRVSGAPEHAALAADITAQIGTRAVRPTPVTAALRLEDVPTAPNGEVTAQGNLLGAPLALAARIDRQSDGALHLAIARLNWKSAEGKGELTLPAGATLPLGQMALRMTRLEELAPLLGQPIAGSVTASLDSQQAQPKPQLRLRLTGQRIALAGNSIDRVAADARIDDPLGAARIAGKLDATGLAVSGVTGNATIDATGPIDAVALRLSADLATSRGPARLSASATTNLPQRKLQIAALDATYAGETAHLLRPATLDAGQGLAIKALRLGLDGAVLDLDGSVTPALDLNLALRDFKPALLQPFMPALNADGMVNITARLGGKLAAPTGAIHVAATGLRWRNGAARGLAVANLDARATLRGTNAAIDARLEAGKSLDLRLSGTAPLQDAGQFDLHAGGALDLVLLDPLLTPAGRNARGKVTLDLALAGSFAAPNLSGSVTLAKVAVHDFVQGVHITDIGGTILAQGDVLHITKLEGRSGSGRLTIAGTVAPLKPGMPVDLTITAQNARLIASDLLTATASGAIKLEGEARNQLQLAGQIKVQRADINLPESLPQQVAVLNVQRPGQTPPAASPPLVVITLGLEIEAPEQVFVRGRGVDAEFSGGLQVAGTSAAPQISGGFKLRRGTFSLAGHTLTFTRGTVTFDGSAPDARLDPALNLAADTTANGVTATLTVTGYADQPKIGLSSTPSLPQDEILSQLFFGQSVKQLSPLQLAEIAQALASLGGVGGPNPLSTLRNALGLDRLAVSGASGNTTGATVEAGKYIASGVYVGAKQGVSGGTQGQVQIDLTKNLKLQTTLASGGGGPVTGATPDNDPGSSIGLTYQFEY